MADANLPDALSAPAVAEAVAFAADAHRGQTRRDGAPFLHHLLEVAALLRSTGHDDEVVVAGLLHDTLERTSTQPPVLQERFGLRVAVVVSALTEDPAIEAYDDRKAALRAQADAAGADAHAVFAADKVAKVRELRERWAPGRPQDRRRKDPRRLAHYQASCELLQGVAADEPLVGQLQVELWLARQLME